MARRTTEKEYLIYEVTEDFDKYFREFSEKTGLKEGTYDYLKGKLEGTNDQERKDNLELFRSICALGTVYALKEKKVKVTKVMKTREERLKKLALKTKQPVKENYIG
jgi:hypothetical protein